MSDVAGSGGYYIAMAAGTIVAEPGTITGSTGGCACLLMNLPPR
jgi:protease-4